MSVAACVVMVPTMFVGAHLLTPSGPTVIRPAAHLDRTELQTAVDEANRAADLGLADVEASCRTLLRELRSDWRLEDFVDELLSFQQKLQLGSGNLRERIAELFARHIAVERQVSQKLGELARAYQSLLAAEDYALLTSHGVDAEAAKEAIAKLDVPIPVWEGVFDRAIQSSLAAVQKDAARNVATFAATNVIGNGIHDGARSAGLNRTQKGGWADFAMGAVIDLAVGAALDAAFDPTEEIVADLRRQLELAEADVLEGPNGLLAFLQTTTEAHQAARREWLLSPTY